VVAVFPSEGKWTASGTRVGHSANKGSALCPLSFLTSQRSVFICFHLSSLLTLGPNTPAFANGEAAAGQAPNGEASEFSKKRNTAKYCEILILQIFCFWFMLVDSRLALLGLSS
jgi:hypothetical protein